MQDDVVIGLPADGTTTVSDSETNGFDRRLTDDEFERYSRQVIVPGMGKEGELLASGRK